MTGPVGHTILDARRRHWDEVYRTKAPNSVSWFEETPTVSLELIQATGLGRDASIVDVGGGASNLVDHLLAVGFWDLAVLDVSAEALARSRDRLWSEAGSVDWVVADVTAWRPGRNFDLWHDRAVFHFLTEPADRAAYASTVATVVPKGGHVIIGSFAPDGPERCSGLPVLRHDAQSLARELGASFLLVEERAATHRTPAGSEQRFRFARFIRGN